MRRIRAFFCYLVSHEPGEPAIAPTESTNHTRLTKSLRIKRVVNCDRHHVFDLLANFLERNVARSVSKSPRTFPGDLTLKSFDSGDTHTQIRVSDTHLIRRDQQIRTSRSTIARGDRCKRRYGHKRARHARQHRDHLRPVKPDDCEHDAPHYPTEDKRHRRVCSSLL
jgi:hypothetical protein